MLSAGNCGIFMVKCIRMFNGYGFFLAFEYILYEEFKTKNIDKFNLLY
jgi:hypothetical protein